VGVPMLGPHVGYPRGALMWCPRVDVTRCIQERHTRRSIEKLPEDAKAELRKFRRTEEAPRSGLRSRLRACSIQWRIIIIGSEAK
jgi:hypothetical protein